MESIGKPLQVLLCFLVVVLSILAFACAISGMTREVAGLSSEARGP